MPLDGPMPWAAKCGHFRNDSLYGLTSAFNNIVRTVYLFEVSYQSSLFFFSKLPTGPKPEPEPKASLRKGHKQQLVTDQCPILYNRASKLSTKDIAY